MKISILYHSETGNTKKISNAILEEINEFYDVNIKTFSIDEYDLEFVNSSKIIFIGTPTYLGTTSWQMKKFLDTNKIIWKNKVCSVFATENHLGGGADFAEISVIAQLLVKGAFLYSIGSSEGMPFTHFGTVCIKDGSHGDQLKRAKLFGKRVVKNVLEEFNI